MLSKAVHEITNKLYFIYTLIFHSLKHFAALYSFFDFNVLTNTLKSQTNNILLYDFNISLSAYQHL